MGYEPSIQPYLIARYLRAFARILPNLCRLLYTPVVPSIWGVNWGVTDDGETGTQGQGRR